MFRLFECCALSFFERFVLSFSLKIERFVSDSAEIWICGLYMISGRMEKRLPEIGVRKAFGATSCVLFSQIIWENLILTVIGGCLGLIISYGMVLLSKNWLLTLLDDNVTALPDGVGVSITPQMLFSPVLFMAAFLICVVINLFSAVIPAYLSLRKDIVYSINKQK